jgi:hypothetical protein
LIEELRGLPEAAGYRVDYDTQERLAILARPVGRPDLVSLFGAVVTKLDASGTEYAEVWASDSRRPFEDTAEYYLIWCDGQPVKANLPSKKRRM